MIGALVGLLFGTGLLIIWRGFARRGGVHSAPARRRPSRRAQLLHDSGIEAVGVGQSYCVQVGCALFAMLIVYLLTRTFAVSACFGVFGWLLVPAVLRRLSRRREASLRDLWPEAVDNLASAVRAGMSLPEALAGLATRGPAPLRAPFARFGSAYRASGRFADCLDALKRDLADPVADRVCETLRVAREVGGSDLGVVLRTLSELLRSDARTRAELETRQGWLVNSARLALAAPWTVLLLLGTKSRGLAAFDSRTGVLVLMIGGVVCAVAYRLMLRLGRLPQPQRVLA